MVPQPASRLAGCMSILLSFAAASADYVEVSADRYVNSQGNSVIDVYLGFDNPADTLVAVDGADITLSGANDWFDNDFTGGGFSPLFPIQFTNDTFVTLGGTPGFTNLSQADPLWGGAGFTQQTIPLGAGWYDPSPTPSQGAVGVVNPSGKPCLYYVFIGRFVVAGTPPNAEIRIGALNVAWTRSGSSYQDSIAGPLVFPYGPPQAAMTCPPSVASTQRAYRLSGLPSGVPWAWSISGPSLSPSLGVQAVGGIVPGAFGFNDARDIAHGFAASVNGVSTALCCPQANLSASAGLVLLPPGIAVPPTCPPTGSGDALLTIRVGEATATSVPTWTLMVGPAGAPPTCVVTSCLNPCGVPDAIVPEIVEIPLSGIDCNGNGEDDVLDIITGASADSDANGIPDECEDAPCSPKSGSCFRPGGEPGCNDVICCQFVCLLDPFCCATAWDVACARTASAVCEPSAPGDFDGDGLVNGADLATLLAAWGTPAADIDGDGTTDGLDLSVLLGNWTG